MHPSESSDEESEESESSADSVPDVESVQVYDEITVRRLQEYQALENMEKAAQTVYQLQASESVLNKAEKSPKDGSGVTVAAKRSYEHGYWLRSSKKHDAGDGAAGASTAVF